MATPTRPSHTHARAHMMGNRRVSTLDNVPPALMSQGPSATEHGGSGDARPPDGDEAPIRRARALEKARVTSPSLPCQAARRALGEAYIGAWLKPGGDAAQITPAEVAAAARASLGQSDRDSLTTEVAEEWMAHLLPKNVKNASFFYPNLLFQVSPDTL
eukprot:CAMPEP_0198678914 /NCGR_PEP_ID=MMETSP1468-20131203/1775_1 /TAXON_ID=1461545 /ORGANISM="Mantoniella sp, Strain CCMP1436" /LENGTH=158 /DNA_ID=CAMNT_0044416931 /DNA_START=53 /DNA_END=530 /DNA_ORIENTATION=-